MFGFGGGFNGPGGGGTNSGSAPSGKDGKSPSERNAAGREGTTSGPGNPGHSPSTSGTGGTGHGPGSGAGGSPSPGGGREYSGFGGREGQRAGPGNPSAQGSAPGTQGRAGGGMAEKGDRVGTGSFSASIDPARFGGPADIDPSRFGPTRGFGAAMGATTAEIDRAAQARAAERNSMSTYDAAVRSREDNGSMADLAATGRAAENDSMSTYNAAAARSAANVTRADAASTARAAETTSMSDFDALKASYRDAIAHIETRGEVDPYNAIGNVTKTGDVAYGKFQVMGANIPSWTKQALGYSMTPKEFLADPKAQDAVFDHIFGGYVAKHGFENAAQAWFGGEDSIGKVNRKDVNGMSVGTYGKTFDRVQQASYSAHKRGLDGSTDVADTNSFASTYLGKDKQKQKDYFGSVPDNQWPGNLDVAQRNGIPAESGDTEAPQQADYTPDPSLTDFPDRPRSNFEKVAAAGLDIGAGLLPGVGMYAGIINSGLSLTGNRTIGERLVDAIATGDGRYTPGAPGDPNRPGYQVADSTVPADVPHKTVPTVESFVDSYLSPPDKTKYPTPFERYDLNRNTYAGV